MITSQTSSLTPPRYRRFGRAKSSDRSRSAEDRVAPEASTVTRVAL
jgi:hypothetical protein